jgi:hypothetical protein
MAAHCYVGRREVGSASFAADLDAWEGKDAEDVERRIKSQRPWMLNGALLQGRVEERGGHKHW